MKNRLVGLRTYLAGPIDRCPDGGKAWRDWITPQLNSRGIIVLDPLNKPFDIGLESDDYRDQRTQWREDEEYDHFSWIMKDVRHVDLRLVDQADFLILQLDVNIHLAGTYEELFDSNRSKKPVLVWCPQGKKRVPDYIFGALPHKEFFDSLEDILSYLDKIACPTESVRTPNRWLFPDCNKLYTHEILDKIREQLETQ